MWPIPLSPALIRLLVVAGAFAAVVGWGLYEKHERHVTELELEHTKADFNSFKGGVDALGRAAQSDKAQKEAKYAQDKKDADHESDLALGVLADELTRLHGERAKRDSSGGFVPGAAGAPGSVKPASVDRAILDDALRTLDTEVQGYVTEGDKGIAGLNTAKKWKQGIK